MTKDEALKLSVNLLEKCMAPHSDKETEECLAILNKAESNKDYATIFHILEGTKIFINQLQAALKQKES